MNPLLKEYKQKVNRFFGPILHRVNVMEYRRAIIVDVEYVDFLNEEHVTEQIREIVGKNVYINVKRECSDSMIKRMVERMGEPTDETDFHLKMERYED
jgi:hypothetical protein